MTTQEIKKIVEESEYEYIGLRADDYEYKIGNICNNSHQLFQDPVFDDDGELVFQVVEDTESPYYGFYDAGELDGTCAIKIYNSEQVEKALEEIKIYYGKHIYLIAGDVAECGNDEDEIIIHDAKVLGLVE